MKSVASRPARVPSTIRMMLLVLTLTFAPTLHAQAGADVLRAVARVEQIERGAENEVLLLRADGTRRPARIYDYLYAGDRLRLTGQSTRVRIRRARGAGTEVLTAVRNSEVSFSERAPTLPEKVYTLVSRLVYWWGDSGRSIPTSAHSRSFNPQDLSLPGTAQLPLRPVLAERQLLHSKRDLVVPVWSGRAVRLVGRGPGGKELFQTLVIGKNATRIRLARAVELHLIGLNGESVRIRLGRGDPAPLLPAWIDPRSPEGGLAAATWLATEGPVEWRLEGYSRLAELAEQDLAAQSIWEALTMEWVVGRD